MTPAPFPAAPAPEGPAPWTDMTLKQRKAWYKARDKAYFAAWRKVK